MKSDYLHADLLGHGVLKVYQLSIDVSRISMSQAASRLGDLKASLKVPVRMEAVRCLSLRVARPSARRVAPPCQIYLHSKNRHRDTD